MLLHFLTRFCFPCIPRRQISKHHICFTQDRTKYININFLGVLQADLEVFARKNRENWGKMPEESPRKNIGKNSLCWFCLCTFLGAPNYLSFHALRSRYGSAVYWEIDKFHPGPGLSYYIVWKKASIFGRVFGNIIFLGSFFFDFWDIVWVIFGAVLISFFLHSFEGFRS